MLLIDNLHTARNFVAGYITAKAYEVDMGMYYKPLYYYPQFNRIARKIAFAGGKSNDLNPDHIKAIAWYTLAEGKLNDEEGIYNAKLAQLYAETKTVIAQEVKLFLTAATFFEKPEQVVLEWKEKIENERKKYSIDFGIYFAVKNDLKNQFLDERKSVL